MFHRQSSSMAAGPDRAAGPLGPGGSSPARKQETILGEGTLLCEETLQGEEAQPAYEPPRIETLGSIAELTRGAPNEPASDGLMAGSLTG